MRLLVQPVRVAREGASQLTVGVETAPTLLLLLPEVYEETLRRKLHGGLECRVVSPNPLDLGVDDFVVVVAVPLAAALP